MMTKNEEDYFFYINWEDEDDIKYRIGILAQIDKMFYLKMHSTGQCVSVKDELNGEKNVTAYDKGCIGLIAFKKDRVYKSDELFDFFKKRLLDKTSNNPCEELKEKKAVSMVDSFSVEEIPEDRREKCKEVILEMYEEQERKRKENLETHSL